MLSTLTLKTGPIVAAGPAHAINVFTHYTSHQVGISAFSLVFALQAHQLISLIRLHANTVPDPRWLIHWLA